MICVEEIAGHALKFRVDGKEEKKGRYWQIWNGQRKRSIRQKGKERKN